MFNGMDYANDLEVNSVLIDGQEIRNLSGLPFHMIVLDVTYVTYTCDSDKHG